MQDGDRLCDVIHRVSCCCFQHLIAADGKTIEVLQQTEIVASVSDGGHLRWIDVKMPGDGRQRRGLVYAFCTDVDAVAVDSRLCLRITANEEGGQLFGLLCALTLYTMMQIASMSEG